MTRISGRVSALIHAAIMVMTLVALAGASFAQTPPAPQPAPSPAPQPSPGPGTQTPDSNDPYTDPSIRPMVDKALDHTTPPPPIFKSPLNKEKTGPGEADAFSNLVVLSNKMSGARYVLRVAEACGSKEDIEKARANVRAAIDALNSAEDQYVRDYSSTIYPPDRLRAGRKLEDSFQSEGRELDDAVQKATTYRAPAVNACPSPRQDTTGNPPPKPQPAPPPPPPPPPVRTPTYSGLGVNPPPVPVKPTAASENPYADLAIGGIGFSWATIGADYKNLSPNIGAVENSYGATADFGILNPLQGLFIPPDHSSFGVDLEAGLHSTDPVGTTTTTWTLGASPFWSTDNWRFGPVLGWQSNSTNSFSTTTLNYGGFAEWFAAPDVTAFAKIGGFSSNTAYDGFYISGALKWYATPDFALNGGIDFTNVSNLGGSNETDYSIGGEYLFSETVPLSLFATYSYSDYYTNYHISSFNIGMRFYLNGDGVNTLVDRQRAGEPPPHQFKF